MFIIRDVNKMGRKVEKNLKIIGMSCAMCVKSIETAVSKLQELRGLMSILPLNQQQ